MSKSMARVRRALEEAGLHVGIHALGEARTAAQAAQVAGCAIDQIAKSIIFVGQDSGRAVLFLTAGGNQVDSARASTVAGEPLGKADAALIRAQTGFAIGGVAPIGHLQPVRAFLDPRLMDFSVIWAAAGTPHHIFPIAPADLHRLTGAQIAEFTAHSK
ncbi:MAG: YbaK/EbsC family protein [Rhodobacterales bacterium]